MWNAFLCLPKSPTVSDTCTVFWRFQKKGNKKGKSHSNSPNNTIFTKCYNYQKGLASIAMAPNQSWDWELEPNMQRSADFEIQ